ncbi:hypothetical protein PUN28_017636 [Cardiocondyla obscurior]|uniref:Uncharacterized protein n=1 Tax=Cardiocondyla obscurior TaxID=286306 RepID=A0AAW2ENT2_9HYME
MYRCVNVTRDKNNIVKKKNIYIYTLNREIRACCTKVNQLRKKRKGEKKKKIKVCLKNKGKKNLLHKSLEKTISSRNTVILNEKSRRRRFMRIFHLAGGAPLRKTPEGYEDFNFEQRLCRYQRYPHCCSRLRTNQIYSTRCRTSIKHSQTTSL